MKQTQEKVAEIQVTYNPFLSKKPVISSSMDAYTIFTDFFPPGTIGLQERFMAMYLNQGNRVLGVYEVSKGGLTNTIVEIRLLFGVALKVAATSIILCHNHPSGNLKASEADVDVTAKIREAGKYFDIRVLDHLIIVPDRKFYSMAEDGIL